MNYASGSSCCSELVSSNSKILDSGVGSLKPTMFCIVARSQHNPEAIVRRSCSCAPCGRTPPRQRWSLGGRCGKLPPSGGLSAAIKVRYFRAGRIMPQHMSCLGERAVSETRLSPEPVADESLYAILLPDTLQSSRARPTSPLRCAPLSTLLPACCKCGTAPSLPALGLHSA